MINDAYCSPDDLDTAISTYHRMGFVVLRGAVHGEDLDLIEAELTTAQDKLIEGTLDSRYGTELLDEPGATFEGEAFRHYVINCTDLSAKALDIAQSSLLKEFADRIFATEDSWLNDYARFGVVYQDARTDEGSKYSRIGWHADFNSDEDSQAWPGFAFTVHIDPTSPANGFLRVVPGSHKRDVHKDEIGSWGFDHVQDEVAVFAGRGDIILHDYRLWHAAARGTADGLSGRRRHVRGSWYAGKRYAQDHGIGTFYKNAAR
ncbi:phytanoyl-CoA dioxygenase family protein [Gammaproteobacteria bacterium]|nr:phytanoyl-CoA dioxygenase family protein [Gammaproteobacteria bacterium]